jgi:signal transduction histidine kinase
LPFRCDTGDVISSDLTPTAVRELLDRQSALLRLTVHELRRPQVVVKGWLSMIVDGSLGSPVVHAQFDQALAAMAGAVQEMATLTDGLAAVAQQDDGMVDVLRYRPCRLQSVVADAVAAVEPEARSRQVSIEQGGPQVAARLDPDRLRIALVNLLGNAVRHSPSGSTVTVAVQAEAGAVTIAVSDEGPGIPPEVAEHIFDPWYRGPSDSDGLGLGLWIVRRIVEWHRGRVTVYTTPGHGSTFCVVLPWHRETLTARE